MRCAYLPQATNRKCVAMTVLRCTIASIALGNELQCSRRDCLTDAPQLVIDNVLLYVPQSAHSAAYRTHELDSVTGRYAPQLGPAHSKCAP